MLEPFIEVYHFPSHIYKQEIPIKNKETPVSLNKNKLKKQEFIKALEKAGGNQPEVSRILGISKVTVWNPMKRHGINLKKCWGAAFGTAVA